MNRYASLALLFTSAALLAACGGGDSSSTSPSPSPSPTPTPAPPPTQTDLADAKKTQLHGDYDQVTGQLTLQWLDTFPQGSSYIVQSREPDGTFATIGTLQGQGGQSGPMSWQHSPAGLTVLRIEANDQGRITPIQTTQLADSISIVTPPKPVTIDINQTEPVTGQLTVSLSDRVQYGEVDWYDGTSQFGQRFNAPGAQVPWNTSDSGSHMLSAYLVTAPDFQVRIHRRVAVSNDGLDLVSGVWSSSGTTYVDIGNDNGIDLTQVAATLDSGTQRILYAPNSCGPNPCTPGQQPSLYEFAYDEATYPGAHTLHATATGSTGASQDMGLLFGIAAISFTPTDGTFVYGTLPLRGSAVGGGSYTVDAYLDDQQILSGATTPFTLDYDLTGVAPGMHTLTVVDPDPALDAPPESRTVFVASSADLVYTPVMSLGAAHPTMLGADGDLLLYVADDGEHLRNVTTGADALLSGSATLANAASWQVDGGYAYAKGAAEDCVSQCIYQWAPDGTRVNLTANDPNVSQYSGLVAKYGSVMWADDAAPYTETLVVYDAAAATYSDIVDSNITYMDADIGVVAGVVHVFYSAEYEQSIVDWSSATGQATRLAYAYYPYHIMTDGVRVVFASDGLTEQIPVGGGSITRGPGYGGGHLSVRDGVDAWLYGSVLVEDPSGNFDSVGHASIVYDTRGGYAVFAGPGSSMSAWNSATGQTALKMNALPNQAIVTADSVYVTLGSTHSVYKVPLP